MMESPTNKTPRNRVWRWLEAVLYHIGIVGVGIWLWSFANNTVVPDWESWSFDRQTHGATPAVTTYLADRSRDFADQVEVWLRLAPPHHPMVISPAGPPPLTAARPALPLNAVVGRLGIPRLGIKAMVREGAEEGTLFSSLGHIPGTALPGDPGNVGVAGHRDTFFRGLGKIRKNDLLEFETTGGNYTYEVVSLTIVKPKDVGVLRAGNGPEMTLVTCYPFGYIGSAPERFIVKARQVSANATEARVETEKPAAEAPPKSEVAALKKPAAPEPAKVAAADPQQPDDRAGDNVLGRRTTRFSAIKGHTRILAPGILLGVTDIDPVRERFTAWVWVKAMGQTMWMRDQKAGEPLVFHNDANGDRYQLTVNEVLDGIVGGYLMLPQSHEQRAASRRPPVRTQALSY